MERSDASARPARLYVIFPHLLFACIHDLRNRDRLLFGRQVFISVPELAKQVDNTLDAWLIPKVPLPFEFREVDAESFAEGLKQFPRVVSIDT